MKITVVGGAGYIGSALVPALVMRRHEVEVVDLFWFGDHLPKEGLRRRHMDAWTLTESDFQGQDTVIFLAGLSNDPMADFDPALNYSSNGALPGYLADQAARAGVKTFIHGGSCSVYGYMVGRPADEDAEPCTSTPYGVSKLMGERGCLQQRDKMRVVAFRMGTVCGASPRMRFDLVINAMVKDAVTKQFIMVNDMDACRPILDIHDAVAAYVNALTNTNMHGVINIATVNARVEDIALSVQDGIKTRLGIDATIVDKQLRDNRSYHVSIDKAKSMGFIPVQGLEATAMNVSKLFNITLMNDIDNPRFYNIETFKSFAHRMRPTAVAASIAE